MRSFCLRKIRYNTTLQRSSSLAKQVDQPSAHRLWNLIIIVFVTHSNYHYPITLNSFIKKIIRFCSIKITSWSTDSVVASLHAMRGHLQAAMTRRQYGNFNFTVLCSRPTFAHRLNQNPVCHEIGRCTAMDTCFSHYCIMSVS